MNEINTDFDAFGFETTILNKEEFNKNLVRCHVIFSNNKRMEREELTECFIKLRNWKQAPRIIEVFNNGQETIILDHFKVLKYRKRISNFYYNIH